MAVTWLLLRGARESSTANRVMVVVKLLALALFIGVGLMNLHPEYYTPFAPNGFTGIHQGAAIVFFAYIGFDAISTAAEETKNPQRNLPIGILGGLAICTAIYVVVGFVLAGMVPWKDLGVADPLAHALNARRLSGASAGLSRSAPSSRSLPCCWSSSTASRASSSRWRATACSRSGQPASIRRPGFRT